MTEKVLTSRRLRRAYYSFFSYRSNGIDYNHRYSSWDLCYKNFQKFFEKDKIKKSDIRIAGLHLGFYLGSWGMFRNSELLNFGIKKYEQLAKELHDISNKSKELDEDGKFVRQYERIQLILKKWKCENINNSAEIKFFLKKIEKKDSSIGNLLELLKTSNANHEDIISKSCEVRKCLVKLKTELEFCKKIKDEITNKDEITKFQKKLKTTPSITLITKIMLGVYANTPAVDQFFNKTAREYFIGLYDKNDAKQVLKKIKGIFNDTKIDNGQTTIEKFIETLPKGDGLLKEKILDGMFFQIGIALERLERFHAYKNKKTKST
jgi:hypothetical protein